MGPGATDNESVASLTPGKDAVMFQKPALVAEIKFPDTEPPASEGMLKAAAT